MRRFAIAALLTLLSFSVVAAPASAGFGWCRSDPVVLIDGHIADIFLTAPLSAPLKVTGPNVFVITTPEGVDAHLVLALIGFGRGEVVRFETSPDLQRKANGQVEIEIAAYVPARDSSMPVGLEFAPNVVGLLWPARVEGTANSWLVLRTLL